MLETGRTLAHFRIIKRLGAGGMGEVYLAEDTKLGRKVALKTLLADFFGDAERKARFYREAKTAAGISHPNVMAIYDMGIASHPDTGQELDYIIMEYIEGRSLTDYLTQTGSDLRTIIRLAEHIAAGLNAAHRLNIIHRDIKADNITVDNDNNPKILDFGLAKPLAPFRADKADVSGDTVSQELTREGKILGTVSYMSPEQIRGEAVDARSDIFSFGILLYRMATGILPFEAATQVSTLAKILESHPEPPRSKNDQIPPELERIIEKCLQKDPGDRYQDTRDLVVDLRTLRRRYDSDVSGPTAIVEKPRGSFFKPSTSRGRRQLAAVSAITIIIIAVLISLITVDTGSDGRQAVQAGENALAIIGFENKTEQDSLDWLRTGLPEALFTDLAQTKSLTIIGRDRVIDFLNSRNRHTDNDYSMRECFEGARQLGAKHVLSGAFYRLGENVRIDARMEEIATGRIVLTEKVVGQDLFAMVDSLTAKIAQSFNVDDETFGRTGVKTYTSSSPEAYKTYLAAMDKFDNELYEEAIAGFEKAIELDSAFALPYMRIGMAHTFQGHSREGAEWFRAARPHADKLPGWEATLLDIYTDIWVEERFDDAFVKMDLLIRDHPNEKESRFIYAALIQSFTRDTTRAFAQLDTALVLDPHYLLALTAYAEFYSIYHLYDQAIVYALRARDSHPDSPSPLALLARLYVSQGKLDMAISEYEESLTRYPGQPDACINLAHIYIQTRDIEKARRSLDQIKERHPDDSFMMSSYFDEMANLTNGEGKFKKAMTYRFESLRYAMATGDSSQIATHYGTIGDSYGLLHMVDSCAYYSRLGYEWGSAFQRFDYPLTLVAFKPNLGDSAEVLMKAVTAEARVRLPGETWPLADAIEQLFFAYRKADTAGLIATHLKLQELNPGGGEGGKREAGYLAVQIGRFDEGKRLLESLTPGQSASWSGLVFPMRHYYLGIAEEGLGNPQAAVKHYQEMLKYWAKPEIELPEIKDARARLARLSS